MSTIIEPRRAIADLRPQRQAVQRRLSQVRARVRSQLALEGVFWTLAAIATFVFVSFAVDRLLRLGVPARVALLILSLAGIAWVCYRYLIQPLSVRLDDLDLAVLLDRRMPGVGQRVASVLQLPKQLEGQPQASPSMILAAVREHAAHLQTANFGSLVDERRRKRFRWALAGVSLLMIVAWGAFPVSAGLWARRWFLGSEVRWPQHTYLTVLGLGDQTKLTAPRGEPLVLQVDSAPTFVETPSGWLLAGRGQPLVVETKQAPTCALPSQVSIHAAGASGKRDGNFAHYEGSNFRYELPPIVETLDITVTGDDDWLGPFQIEPVDRPAVESLTIAARRLGSKRDEVIKVGESEQQLLFLPKTRLELRLRTTQSVRSAEVLGAGAAAVKLVREDDRNYVAQWEMQDPLTLEVRLTSSETGLISKPYFLSIGVQHDREPRITVRSTGIGRRVTPQARIPLAIRATDDFGVAEVGVEMEVSAVVSEKLQTTNNYFEVKKFATESEEGDKPAGSNSAPPLETDLNYTVSLRDRGLLPGNMLKLRALAKDDCVLGVHTGYSRSVNLQVVSPEELFYEILMRQRDQRAKFAVSVKSAKTQAETLADLPTAEEAPGLVRSQQVVTRQVWQVANQLDATLQEMTLNDLGTQQTRDLLSTNVIAPLRTMHDDLLVRLRGALDTLAADKTPTEEHRAEAQALQAEAAAAMQRILDQMSQWESFVDVTNQLRQIIKLQDQVLESTQEMRKQKTDELFDP